MKCQQLVIIGNRAKGPGVRACRNIASFEVYAIASTHYPEEVQEYLCTRHANKVIETGLAPDVRVRRVGSVA